MGNITFTGISSGLDTDSMIEALLMNYQNKIDRAQQKQAKLEYKQEAWNKMNDTLNNFYSKVDNMRLTSSYTATKATTNSSAVTVHTTGSTTKGTHTIKVTELATSASVVAKMEKLPDNVEKTKKLVDLNLGIVEHKVSQDESGSVLQQGDTLTITVDNEVKEITIEQGETLATLETKLKALDKNLSINIDTKNKTLFISSTETGDKSITLGGTLKDKLFGTNIQEVQGKDAQYTYNGVAGFTSSSNNIEVNGISMTLNEVTTVPVKVEISSDSQPVVSMIKDFVDAYNELISDMDKQYNATSTGLEPLTDAEKEDMTASEIEKYEEKLKAEALRKDSTLKTVRDSLRNSLQGVLSSNKNFKDLASIGITTGTWSENGKLYLDEEKLTAALEKDSGEVIALLTQKSIKNADESKTPGGIMSNMYDTYEAMRKRIESVKSYKSYYNDYVMKDNITSAKSAVTKAKEKYEAMRKIYEAKFTAMETALSTINSQGSTISSWLSS